MMLDVASLFDSPVNVVFTIGNLIAMGAFLAIVIAVGIDFLEYQKRGGVKKEKKSIIETGTMFLFFFLFYSLIRFGFGRLDIQSDGLRIGLMIVGSMLLLIGAIVNVRGRFDLGKNWANQIKVYADHTMIQTGMYRYVRHPLYASIIWMFIGASLIYANYAALLANLCIFIPAMYYRAKQEEKLLAQEFQDYLMYQKHVGMFFPNMMKRYEKN